MFEIGALSSIKSTNPSTRQRRYLSIEGQTQPTTRRSLDLRIKKLTELSKSLHKRSQSPIDFGS